MVTAVIYTSGAPTKPCSDPHVQSISFSERSWPDEEQWITVPERELLTFEYPLPSHSLVFYSDSGTHVFSSDMIKHFDLIQE